MWRRRGLIVVVASIAIVLAGTLPGVACTSTEIEDESLPNAPGVQGRPGMPESLLASVAETLGIDQQDLQDAFAQAQSEMPDVGPWQGTPDRDVSF